MVFKKGGKYKDKGPWQLVIIMCEFSQEIEHYAGYYEGGEELCAADAVEDGAGIVRGFHAVFAEGHKDDWRGGRYGEIESALRVGKGRTESKGRGVWTRTLVLGFLNTGCDTRERYFSSAGLDWAGGFVCSSARPQKILLESSGLENSMKSSQNLIDPQCTTTSK